MPMVRTIFRPHELLEVDEAEAYVLKAQGLLAPEPEPELEAAAEPAPATKAKTAKGSTSGSEEGSGQERDGLPGGPEADREEVGGEPDSRGSDPRGLDPQSGPEGQESQSEPEEGSPREEEGLK